MDGTTVGLGLVLLVGFVLFAVWAVGRARGQASGNPFELDRSLGPDRGRGLGSHDPGSWRSPGDGRW